MDYYKNMKRELGPGAEIGPKTDSDQIYIFGPKYCLFYNYHRLLKDVT